MELECNYRCESGKKGSFLFHKLSFSSNILTKPKPKLNVTKTTFPFAFVAAIIFFFYLLEKYEVNVKTVSNLSSLFVFVHCLLFTGLTYKVAK